MMPELALLVGKKGSEFSSDMQLRQTGRTKRLFESAIQEQQKTLPLDRVVKNGCRGRGGIWRLARMGGGGRMQACPPRLAVRLLCCQLQAVGARWGEETDEHAGKQVELRGEDRQTDKVSISERDGRMERRNQV